MNIVCKHNLTRENRRDIMHNDQKMKKNENNMCKMTKMVAAIVS